VGNLVVVVEGNTQETETETEINFQTKASRMAQNAKAEARIRPINPVEPQP